MGSEMKRSLQRLKIRKALIKDALRSTLIVASTTITPKKWWAKKTEFHPIYNDWEEVDDVKYSYSGSQLECHSPRSTSAWVNGDRECPKVGFYTHDWEKRDNCFDAAAKCGNGVDCSPGDKVRMRDESGLWYTGTVSASSPLLILRDGAKKKEGAKAYAEAQKIVPVKRDTKKYMYHRP